MSWKINEDIAMGIVNPGSCTRVTKPSNITLNDFKLVVSSWVKSVQGDENLVNWLGETLLLHNEDAISFSDFLKSVDMI